MSRRGCWSSKSTIRQITWDDAACRRKGLEGGGFLVQGAVVRFPPPHVPGTTDDHNVVHGIVSDRARRDGAGAKEEEGPFCRGDVVIYIGRNLRQ